MTNLPTEALAETPPPLTPDDPPPGRLRGVWSLMRVVPAPVYLTLGGVAVWAALSARDGIAWWFALGVVVMAYAFGYAVFRVPRMLDLGGELDHLDEATHMMYLEDAGRAAAVEREAHGLKHPQRQEAG